MNWGPAAGEAPPLVPAVEAAACTFRWVSAGWSATTWTGTLCRKRQTHCWSRRAIGRAHGAQLDDNDELYASEGPFLRVEALGPLFVGTGGEEPFKGWTRRGDFKWCRRGSSWGSWEPWLWLMLPRMSVG